VKFWEIPGNSRKFQDPRIHTRESTIMCLKRGREAFILDTRESKIAVGKVGPSVDGNEIFFLDTHDFGYFY